MTLVGLGCDVLFVALITYMVSRPPWTQQKALLVVLGVGLVLAFAYQLSRLTKPQLVLYSDRIEKPGLFQTQILNRVNVRGVGKTIRSRSGAFFVIESNVSGQPHLRFDAALRKDPVFAEWLSGAPDPAAEALKAEHATILADPRYGSTEVERTRRLKLTKQLITGFSIACLALAIWVGFLAPLAWTTLLVVAVPLVVAAGLVQTSNGLVVWFGRPGRPRVIAAVAPAVALAAHAGLTVHLLNSKPLVVAGVLAGVAGAALAYTVLATDTLRLRRTVMIAVVAGLTAYGLGVALDVSLDAAPSRTFVATVEGVHVSHGRSTSYYLDLSPWSDQPAREVSVSSALYDSTPVGSRVCLVRHPGRLGLDWFDVAHCAAADAPLPSATPRSGVRATNWLAQPSGADLADLYPDKAQRQDVEGAAAIRCTVLLDGSLSGCAVVSETPPGYGFGAATVRAAARFRMRPATRNGQPLVSVVTIPMRWRLH